MNFVENLKDDTIIVTNYAYKLDILKKINATSKLLSIKFMTMDELVKKFYFSYDEKAIYYLMDKYKIKREIAFIYLKNIYYVSNTLYNNKKLDLLVKIKEDLISNNLLIYDELFLDYIKNKNIVFYNYNYFTVFENDMILKLKNVTNVEIINKEYRNFSHEILEFNDIFEEVEYVAREINNLIYSGVSVKNIKIANFNEEYLEVINTIFPMYNLKIDNSVSKVISTKVAKEFLSLEGDIFDRINKLCEKYKNSKVLEQVINIVNKYIDFSNFDIVLEMIEYDFKNTLLNYKHYNNAIEIIDYTNYPVLDDMYVFMISFNQNSIPLVCKDEDFIPDSLKKDLLIDDTSYVNKMNREVAISNILNIKNLVITYKNSSPFSSYYPSNLIADLGFDVKKGNCNLNTSYSTLADKFKLCKMLDNYIKTGEVTDKMKFLYSNYSNINYNLYNNKFTGIDKELFKEYLLGKFNLSYSSMDSFYKCPFRYYLSFVLRLDIYEESFEAYIGSLFHYVLEKALKYNKEIDFLVDEFIKKSERVLTRKEEFFVLKLRKEIEFVYKNILEQMSHSNLNKMLFEERVEVVKNGDLTVTFKGFIDKVVYEEKEDYVICAIIDYKTGFTDINLGFVNSGLSMQLPIYLYLARNSSNLKDAYFSGFYLQRVLSGLVSIDNKKNVEDIKKEALLLYGYSNSNLDILYEFDNTYKESKFIKSMKLDKNGNLSRFSKVLSNEQIDKLIEVTDKKIDEAILRISNCEFDINPKRTEKELLGCKFCKYNDICFKEVKDEVLIEEDKDLSFLGGDLDA